MIKCYVCGGNLEPLGALGNLVWYRCVDCGAEQSTETEQETNSECKSLDYSRIVEIARIVVMNASLIPDPQMEGLTDTYAVPLDDIQELKKALGEE